MAKSPNFPGFPLGLSHFLEELSRNNNKRWFDTNKDRYERDLRIPALGFIAAMAKPLAAISPHFRAEAKKVGGSLMRIHRDVRFGNDKTPYKTNVGIHFRHESAKDVHAPGFYFHIDLNEVFLGAGVWHPESTPLAAIRTAIAEEPKRWKRVRDGKRFRTAWDLGGDTLKRPPRGYEADDPMIEDLKRKDHIAVTNLSHDDLFADDVVDRVSTAFRSAKPYVGFLCEALKVPF
ncbi:DUF2461 domain-containing protein [Botrimarina hoheduenensis]|uniref:TIGR02453 family protein n=1 Tax=Botrimarina hoheduenensis TaxID=2528000 RepID=A0A5C5WD98_9BACT|nr:DUF2461 domain-containing protein [Botrimarina hoheduenensis]TWT47642.1 hypothetical protein Pla111_12580 [Botrimarina hoheduenensis]